MAALAGLTVPQAMGPDSGDELASITKTLATFLEAITNSGLNIRAVQEFSSGGVVLPRNIGFIAEK